MHRLLLVSMAGIFGASGVQAGGVERSLSPIGFLFEEGTYGELGLSAASADVSGTAPAALGGFGSGDMVLGFGTLSLAYKTQLTPELSIGLLYDEPFGADVSYDTGTGYYAQGARAELESHALTALARYKLPSNFSVYGGVRYQTLQAEADLPYIPVPGGYVVEGERDEAFGYLLGVAYERPEIALRVSLTYASAIDHELDTTETSLIIPPAGIAESVTKVTTPQSLTLDFQTGIAADTLLFGSVRWTDWTEFEISPAFYVGPAGFDPLVESDDDYIAYSLGVGRRLSDAWSIAAAVAYEPQTGGVHGNLGPTDGFTSLGLAATYTYERVKVTGGLRYVWVGDAETPQGAEFEDNDAVAVALRVGYTF